MNRIILLLSAIALVLLLGMSIATAADPIFVPGPTVAVPLSANNSGFTWGDVNGDGILDVFTRQNNIMLNSITSFTQLTTANLPLGGDACGVGFADFNGDGVLDVFEVAQTSWNTQVWTQSAGVFSQLTTGAGDLATAGGNTSSFGAIAAADINHSNYLSLAWAGQPGGATIPAGGNSVAAAGGIWLLKGGASGFTNIGNGSTVANRGIDTSRSFESWNISFLDANNDGYPDLLVPSFRNGFSRVDSGSYGTARKGTILYMNDGTGKFFVPTATTLGRPIWAIDSLKLNAAKTADSLIFASQHADTGIIVDDTVRHFEALSETFGDFNSDGIFDLLLASNGANNIDAGGNFVNVVILYGKGDGTFTYKWNASTDLPMPSTGIPSAYVRGWKVGDYNNDGFLDILATDNGGTNVLFKNNGNGTFTNVTSTAGLTSAGIQMRGAAFVDYNNDGLLDIYSLTGTGSTLLMSNANGNTNKWIGFKPIGTGNNKSAIGAIFKVYSASSATPQIRRINSEADCDGSGGDLWANFGLGAATKVDSLQVIWPDGTQQSFVMGAANNALAVNTYYTIQEGSVIPAAPVITRPSWAAGDTTLSNTDTLKWNAGTSGTGATTYNVQVATNASFSSIAKTVSAVSGTSTVLKLGLSTKYYWRVQELDNQLTSPYSAIDSFRTKIAIDSIVPVQLSPVNNSKTVAAKNPKLVVSYVSTASTYHFQLRSDSVGGFKLTSGFVVNDSTSDFDTTWTIATALTPSKTYYWRVRGYNPAGSSAFSPIDSFTVMYLPAAPTLAYPTPNQANVSVTPSLTMKWNHVAGDTNYAVQLWSFNSTGKVLLIDTTKHDTSWTVSGLASRVQYFWQVNAFNQGGSGPASVVDSFTTVTEVALAPVLVSPKAPATSIRNATFVWNSAVNALNYHVQLSNNSGFTHTNIIDTVVVQDTTLASPITLDSVTTYYWRVSSINLGGEGAFSAAAHFTTTTITGVASRIGEVPKAFSLSQNYPNPFNPTTTINYDLAKTSNVKLVVYDVLGRVVATLANGLQQANSYSVQFNASRLSSGVYFYRIEARSQDGSTNFISVKKLLLMK